MVSKTLSTSRKFAKLSSEFSQVLYVLIVAHADDFGRQSGDAFTVKHQVFPVSPRTEAEFESAILDLVRCGLIERYDGGNGEPVLQVVSFESHQVGLHKRSSSRFPEPPGTSGKFPEIPSEEKRREENSTEGKGTAAAPPVVILQDHRKGERRTLTTRRNGFAEYEHPRFDVPTWWHAENVKGLSGGESRMMQFYRWLAERVERTNEDTLPRKEWLNRCFAEWLSASRVTASSVPSPAETARMIAERVAKAGK